MSVPIKILSATRWGATNLLRAIVKYWYWIIFLVIIIPTLITSVQTAKETNNPFYPAIQLGLHITNADAIINKDVNTLREDPQLLIGMEKPTQGIWKHFVYYWKLFLVFWRFLGNVWLITFPFVIIYKGFRFAGIKGKESSKLENMKSTLIWGLIFIFIMNLIMTIYSLVAETIEYNLPEGASLYQKVGLIILTTLPFHGIANLISYLIGVLS